MSVLRGKELSPFQTLTTTSSVDLKIKGGEFETFLIKPSHYPTAKICIKSEGDQAIMTYWEGKTIGIVETSYIPNYNTCNGHGNTYKKPFRRLF